MKAVKLNLGGKVHYLAFNGEAMFAIQDTYGSAEALLEAIAPNTKESFSALCTAIAILAEQGELARRDLSYTAERLFTAEEFQRLAMPPDIVAMKQAIPQTITLGFGREVAPENDEVDLVLAEINQKKNDLTRAHYIRMGTLAGLSARETLRSPPGLVFDLFELYLRAHTVKQKQDDD